jgi:hypothetical protein
MKSDSRGPLMQWYLLLCRPTRFLREVENFTPAGSPRLSYRERLDYLLEMFPWMVVIPVFGNNLVGLLCTGAGIEYHWGTSWSYVVCGLVISMVFGLWPGVAFGLAGSAAIPVAIGVAAGVFGEPVRGEGGVAFAGGFAVAFGLAFGLTLGPGVSLALGALLGGAACLLMGGLFGWPSGVAAGVTLTLVFWATYFRLVMYPFDLAWTTILYLRTRWKPSAVSWAWKCCPIAWNEVIWLPLPFAARLLVLLVRHDRAEGFRQIAFVAAERSLQRRVAQQALLEVVLADLEAGSVKEIVEVAERLRRMSAGPTPQLFGELSPSLERFDRGAQFVGQYLTLQSPFRRGEALDRAREEIEGLQRVLVVSPGKPGPRLLRVVNQWAALLEAEQSAYRASAAVCFEIPNPFVFGNPVSERDANVFTGRQDVVRRIEESVLGSRQAPTLLLHGPRRMGKTSILLQLPRLLGPDFAPALLDCQNPAVTSSAATLFAYLSRTISTALQGRHLTVEPLRREALKEEPYAVVDEWLDDLERMLPERMRILLCLDEYESLQNILDAGWGASFLDYLRHTLQHRSRLVLMFTGAHTFEEQGPAWTHRFVSARRLRVSFLDRNDLVPLLTKPLPDFDMTYAAGALDALLDATVGQPFLTQAVAYELVQLLNRQRRRDATPADVEQAIEQALVTASEYFANLWFDAGEAGRTLLSALAWGEPPPKAAATRKRLREQDILKDDGFAVPMVERWVRANTRPAQHSGRG